MRGVLENGTIAAEVDIGAAAQPARDDHAGSAGRRPRSRLRHALLFGLSIRRYRAVHDIGARPALSASRRHWAAEASVSTLLAKSARAAWRSRMRFRADHFTLRAKHVLAATARRDEADNVAAMMPTSRSRVVTRASSRRIRRSTYLIIAVERRCCITLFATRGPSRSTPK